MKRIDVPLFFRLWNAGTSTDDIAAAMGISRTLVYTNAKRYGLQNRAVMTAEKNDPPPEVIAQRAAAIRATWTPEEEAKRLVGNATRRWSPPRFRRSGAWLDHCGSSLD